MKRALKWAAVGVLLLLIAAGSVWYSAFGNNSAIVDGQQLVPGVETVKDGFVSVFVLDAGPRQVALIDAGNDASGKAILAALARRGLTAGSVAAIFLTHGHGDHTAACKLFPDAQVYALESEVALIGDAIKVTHPLKDGDASDVGEVHFKSVVDGPVPDDR